MNMNILLNLLHMWRRCVSRTAASSLWCLQSVKNVLEVKVKRADKLSKSSCLLL